MEHPGTALPSGKAAAIARWLLSLLNNEKMKNNEMIVNALKDMVRQPYVVMNPLLSGEFGPS